MEIDNKKALMIGGGVLVVGVLAFILIRTIKRKKNKNFQFPIQSATSQSGGGSSSNTGGGGSSTNTGGGGNTGQVANYNSYADRQTLFEAMDGWGTDEDAVQSVANSLSPAQRKKLQQDWDSNTSLYEGETLKEWIEGDFSGSQKRKLINAFYF